ncbi:hypothetical protein [Deinococcus koreensis]|uniref:Uncharacterized protein n=1 Tax=Deinococcus koreensis TaxID=2054903 RepID=A0A2K3UW22_9DEIO|nr:hypothetical protein [Deinococcus koreensis]PNY80735.1 hypothetical protein CVO96_04560 [Deinococcus koreensis]
MAFSLAVGGGDIVRAGHLGTVRGTPAGRGGRFQAPTRHTSGAVSADDERRRAAHGSMPCAPSR